MTRHLVLFDTSIYIPCEHLNDVLILLSGARAGAEVVTENAKPFTRWAALLRRMRVPVRMREVRREDYLG